MPPKATAEEVHDLCDRLEAAVGKVLPGTQVLVHPEPTLELDRTRPAVELARQILDGHRELFLGYRDLHAHEDGGQVHISLRMSLAPGTTVEEIQSLVEHLRGHLRGRLPEAEVYIHPEVGQG